MDGEEGVLGVRGMEQPVKVGDLGWS